MVEMELLVMLVSLTPLNIHVDDALFGMLGVKKKHGKEISTSTIDAIAMHTMLEREFCKFFW